MTYTLRGVVYNKQGKFTKAISDFDKAIEINPNDSTVYIERGMAYDKQGNHVQAGSDYNQAVLGYTKSIEKFKTEPFSSSSVLSQTRISLF